MICTAVGEEVVRVLWAGLGGPVQGFQPGLGFLFGLLVVNLGVGLGLFVLYVLDP